MKLKYLIHTCEIDFIVNYKGWRVKFYAAFTRCEHLKLIFTINILLQPENHRALEADLEATLGRHIVDI